MRPHGDPTGVVDPPDGLADGGVGARDVAGRALDQVRRDERGDVRVALVGEALRVRGMLEHGRGEVGTPDRLARRPARLERRGVDLVPQLAQPVAHPLRSPDTVVMPRSWQPGSRRR